MENGLMEFITYFLNQNNTDLDTRAKKFRDSYVNNLTNTGGIDFAKGDYTFENLTLDFGKWNVLYSTNWVFRRIIDKPAQDMVKKGITIHGSMTGEEKKKIYNILKTLNQQLIYAIQQGRLFGGGIAVMLIEGFSKKDLEKPLDLKKIPKKAKIRLESYDRWYGVSNLGNERVTEINDDYNTPEFYQINFQKNGAIEPVKVHYSWCIRLRNRKAPRLIEQQLYGWDMAEGSHLYEELIRNDKIKATIPALLDKSLIEVFKMNGIQGLFSGMTGVEQSQIENRLSMITRYRNYRNITFLETTDDYKQFQYSPSGLDGILEQMKDQVAGCAEMPRVMLFGETKGGLTSDSPAELEIYDGNINSKQEEVYRPMLNKLLPVLCSILGIEMPEDFTFDFNPIREISTLDKQKRVEKLMSICVLGVQNGILSPKIAALEIKKISNETGFGDTITDEFINSLKDEPLEIDANNVRIKEQEEGIYTETHKEQKKSILSKFKKGVD